jgi:hypothetical protein
MTAIFIKKNNKQKYRTTIPDMRYAFSYQYPQKITLSGEGGQRFLWPFEYSNEIKKIIIHNTGEYLSGKVSPERVMKAIQTYHAKILGWGDIGYNYVIDKNGNVYEGRKGGDKVIGGHTAFYNLGTIGISLMGNFNTEQPTVSQLKTLKTLVGYLSFKYKVDLNDESTHLGIKSKNLAGHLDVTRVGYRTSCPGINLYKYLDEIRNDAMIIARNIDEKELRGKDFITKRRDLKPKKSLFSKIRTKLFANNTKKQIISIVPESYKIFNRNSEEYFSITIRNNSEEKILAGTRFETGNAPEGMFFTAFSLEEDLAPDEKGHITSYLKINNTPNGIYQINIKLTGLKNKRSIKYRIKPLQIKLQISGDRNFERLLFSKNKQGKISNEGEKTHGIFR